MTGTLTEAERPSLMLSKADRCDRCGAQAFVLVAKAGAASELLFCAHHFHKHAPELFAAGWTTETDHRDLINERPTS